jgi:hypothetical protein
MCIYVYMYMYRYIYRYTYRYMYRYTSPHLNQFAPALTNSRTAARPMWAGVGQDAAGSAQTQSLQRVVEGQDSQSQA